MFFSDQVTNFNSNANNYCHFLIQIGNNLDSHSGPDEDVLNSLAQGTACKPGFHVC
ncbi:unnamed protein product [Trifolium pratense]|uniref:Uncharacterized protein n=1 Tax=Trifolium pratense TaxID=57577 RepID=A0ACB0KYM4_TRIPR|nr:unnamed protein product [Trifolium pratense]